MENEQKTIPCVNIFCNCGTTLSKKNVPTEDLKEGRRIYPIYLSNFVYSKDLKMSKKAPLLYSYYKCDKCGRVIGKFLNSADDKHNEYINTVKLKMKSIQL